MASLPLCMWGSFTDLHNFLLHWSGITLPFFQEYAELVHEFMSLWWESPHSGSWPTAWTSMTLDYILLICLFIFNFFLKKTCLCLYLLLDIHFNFSWNLLIKLCSLKTLRTTMLLICLLNITQLILFSMTIFR